MVVKSHVTCEHSWQGFFHHAPVDNLTSLRDMAPYFVNTIIPDLKIGPDDQICARPPLAAKP